MYLPNNPAVLLLNIYSRGRETISINLYKRGYATLCLVAPNWIQSIFPSRVNEKTNNSIRNIFLLPINIKKLLIHITTQTNLLYTLLPVKGQPQEFI